MHLTQEQIATVIQNASQKLADYCLQHDLHAVVTGVSGGLDSAVTLGLSAKAQEICRQQGHTVKNVGLILPCHSDPEHAVLGKKVIQTFQAELLEIDLSGVFDFVEKAILRPIADQLSDLHTSDRDMNYRTAQGNVKARMRMAFGTYYVANMINGMVLSTDNYSEMMMGFWTLHGDVGDFGMIQNLWKGTELPQIAEALGVPQEVIDAAPTDGLNVLPGGDEAQLGAKYQEVDEIIRKLQEQGIDLDGSPDQLNALPDIGYDATLVRKIAIRALKNAFKRKNPLNLSREELGL